MNLHNCACGYKYKECKMLLETGEDPNIRDEHGITLLLYATMYGHKDCIQLLFEYGADPNIQDDYGGTPLHEAVLYHDIELVTFLLEHVKERIDTVIENIGGALAKD